MKAIPEFAVIENLKRSWWFAWIAATVLGLANLKDAADGFEKVCILVGLKPDSLALSRDVEKSQFAREFSETAWRRLFWANAYVGRVEAGQSQNDIDDAYKAYVLATEAWHSKLMTFELLTERFHGNDRAQLLTHEVAPMMNELTVAVSAIRFPEIPKRSPDYTLVRSRINDANLSLRNFILGAKR